MRERPPIRHLRNRSRRRPPQRRERPVCGPALPWLQELADVLAGGLIRDDAQAHLAVARVAEQPPSSTSTLLLVWTRTSAVRAEARLLLVSEDGEVPHEPDSPAESPGTTTATLDLITAFPRMQVRRRRSGGPSCSPDAQPAPPPAPHRREWSLREPCSSAVARVGVTMRSRSPPIAELCVSYNRPPPTGDRQAADRAPPKDEQRSSVRRVADCCWLVEQKRPTLIRPSADDCSPPRAPATRDCRS